MEEEASIKNFHLNEDTLGAQLRLEMLGCKEKCRRKTPTGRGQIREQIGELPWWALG